MGAAGFAFHVIERFPDIDTHSTEGLTPENFVPSIEFQEAKFSYATRETVPILQGLNLKHSAGMTMAIVGPSGCGKSTILSLIQRFYKLDEGRLLIGGIPIEDYNVNYLRKRIGIVSQEPILFGLTIEENIKIGFEVSDI